MYNLEIPLTDKFFSEIFKFRENTSKTNFAKFLKVFMKSRNLDISRKELHIRNLQITCFKMTYNMFIFEKVEFFRTPTLEPFGESFREIFAHKIAKSKYF